jgi:hypothetical protein
MKLWSLLLLVPCLAAFGETEEKINRRFPVQPGARLVVDVDFGSIDVQTNAVNEVLVDVVRRVGRGRKAEEEQFLAERPVTFSSEGNTVTIHARAKSNQGWATRGRQRTEGRYTLTVPAQCQAQLRTAGGAIAVRDLTGPVNASTSGGSLKFTRVRGDLDGITSGGAIQIADCEGALKVKTSGGAIDVAGGAGSLDGLTSGGPVAVKNFHGGVEVRSSGGGITVENVTGKVEGATSGGAISARFGSPLSEPVKLETTGGGVTFHVAENAAFDLDASTSGGRVSCELPVVTGGKPTRQRLKGPVNGGGKPVVLRTSGGSIAVRKL